jgi:hypothetical protein
MAADASFRTTVGILDQLDAASRVQHEVPRKADTAESPQKARAHDRDPLRASRFL